MATGTVRYWAGAARAAGRQSQECDVADLREVRALLGAEPGLAKLSTVAALLVDGAQHSESGPLTDGAVVDVLPPFAGGSTSLRDVRSVETRR